MQNVQMMGVVSPPPYMVSEENYEPGEILLPHNEGLWTLYSIMPIYQKEGTTELRPPVDCAVGTEPGNNAERACRVVWVAADDVSYVYTQQNFRQQQAAINAANSIVAAPPGLKLK